jgi:hypothetical protein
MMMRRRMFDHDELMVGRFERWMLAIVFDSKQKLASSVTCSFLEDKNLNEPPMTKIRIAQSTISRNVNAMMDAITLRPKINTLGKLHTLRRN